LPLYDGARLGNGPGLIFLLRGSRAWLQERY
jgi:hypothetical protein